MCIYTDIYFESNRNAYKIYLQRKLMIRKGTI